MSDFRTLLGAFRAGVCSAERLLAEVDAQVERHVVDPVTLLAWLDEEHAAHPMPRQLHEVLAGRILAALEVATPVAAAGGSSRRFRDLDAATLVVGATPGSDGLLSDLLATGPHLVIAAEGSILKHRFKLQECIGEGGMGRVYKAIDLRRVEARATDIHVAVKILTTSFSEYAGSLVLLQREATKLQTLPHPNIVRVIDCDRDGHTVFMTMEYLEGKPLKQVLTESSAPHSGAEAMRILERIADALSFAHANRIVHGDLKPGNVILTQNGEVKVIDFGFARAIAHSGHGGAPANPESPESAGALTPSHASPEMLAGQPPDPRDDIYALACIAYELLTGAHPFHGQQADLARLNGLQPRRRPPLTRAQLNAIAGGLQFDRERRTPTVQAFMQQLRGDRAARSRRIAAVAIGALLFLAAMYWFLRPIPVAPPALPVVGDEFRDCPDCPLMRVVAGGRFEQGSDEMDPDAQPFEKPRHTTTLPRSLAFGVQEVTRAQYAAFAGNAAPAGGCTAYDGNWSAHPDLSWKNVGFPQTPSHPVTCVSWADAQSYVQWLSKKTGHTYRLPSASEWEYAARAGSNQPRAWGDKLDEACGSANVADESAAARYPGWQAHPCADGYVYTAPVGAFMANAFGLHDMLGNVFEWVQDCWHESYQKAPTNGTAWEEPGCAQHEMRGGSWFTTPTFVRAAYRNRFEGDARSNTFGFRVIRELTP